MFHIIITGAGGLVATELAFSLLKQTDAHLYLLSTHVSTIHERYRNYKERVKCFTLQTFIDFSANTDIKFDYCIHTAFSRSSSGNQIVESIEYQRSLLSALKKIELKVFINISSQSVYGKTTPPLWKEDSPVDPDYLYAMGKYFSEVVTQQILEGSNIKWTNIRLCSVCENARFVRVFVQNSIEGKNIILTAPNQRCSFIHVQDVASGLMALIEKAEYIKLLPVYNLGANLVNTIGEIANMVKSIAIKKYNLKEIDIIEQAYNNNDRIGMDSTLFMNTFMWKPKYNMENMITDLFEMLTNTNGGGYPISFKYVYNL